MSEELTTSLISRVNAFVGAGDPSQVLADEGLAEALALRRIAATDTGGATITVQYSVVHALGWFHYCRYSALPVGKDTADLLKALTCFGLLIEPRPDLVPEKLVPVLRARAQRTPEESGREGYELLRGLGPDDDPYLLDHAVGLLRTAATATSDARIRMDTLNALSVGLNNRFEWFGEPSDQDEAIEAGRAAVTEATQARLPTDTVMSNLAVHLRSRFLRTRDADDLDEAIGLARQAVAAVQDPDDRLSNLSMLALTLRARGQHHGSLADLDEAVESLRAVVAATPSGHSYLYKRLGNLVSVLSSRFDVGGDPGDLDAAVIAAEATLDRVGPEHPDWADMTSTLSDALHTRYERIGDEESLARAIERCRAAVHATPTGSVKGASRLSDLDRLLRNRYTRYEELADLDEAITAARGAVSATVERAPARAGYLSHLALGLRIRGSQTENLEDLAAAVDAGRAAVALQPLREVDHAGHLSNLASALSNLAERTSDRALLDEALDAARRSVDLTPTGDATRNGRLMNLGVVLRQRHSIAAEDLGAATLDEAIRLMQESADQARDGDPNRAMMLMNLGLTLFERFRRDEDGTDAEAAIQAYRAASDMGHAVNGTRFEASRQWGEVAAITGQWANAADGYTVALDTFLMLASLRLSRASRERLLAADGVTLASNAAAAALHAGRTNDTVRYLEQGRAVLWSQSLHLGTDLARLSRIDSGLAERLSAVRKELNSLDTAAGSPGVGTDPGVS